MTAPSDNAGAQHIHHIDALACFDTARAWRPGRAGGGGSGAGGSGADAGAGLVLRPGDLVVLTGMSEARGLVVWPDVKKGVAAVIAQDPVSGSGKARKAREYGIPVVGEGVLG